MLKVNGEALDYRAGMTVADVLKAKAYVFPLLVVKVNGVLVPRDQYQATKVPDGAEVQVVHLMSGG